ncbi:YtxH domain-containing protein [Bacillus massiliglaciei]|uniref:YtxH domain-containing protein n=1 Tax=Bacillus massiliglaciei TaxID=1816693 RepID=UPI000DA617EA|nr:YtxH domain-containing protein [Bacillus massiliglaciei]
MRDYSVQYKDEKRSKFMQAVFLGAFAGAAISLFDKETRETVRNNSQKCLAGIKNAAGNPTQFLNQMRDTSAKVRTTIEKISSDVAFISERMEEMKNIPPQVASVVKETKEAFTSDEHDAVPDSSRRQADERDSYTSRKGRGIQVPLRNEDSVPGKSDDSLLTEDDLEDEYPVIERKSSLYQ